MSAGAADEVASEVWLIRHGETEWSLSGQHTGVTDLPLTLAGEERARALAPSLARMAFDRVLSSPLQRACRTADLAGLRDVEICDDLVEWRYGDYEGVTTADIRKTQPDWSVWTAGAPNGESPAEISARVDRVIERCQSSKGRTLLVAHGHVLRSLAARWIEQPVTLGAHLPLGTAKLCVLGFDRGIPTVERWNAEPSPPP
ncbi:MAG: histidine phosphatase family protein [Nocardioidaceae bacterium]|nr:histidine phosphatase family protein [Nocardioidaceae bacterium]